MKHAQLTQAYIEGSLFLRALVPDSVCAARVCQMTDVFYFTESCT